MYYKEFKGKQLSGLGFGAMRLPTDCAGNIDQAKVQTLIDYAMEQGINYFDTAYPYHKGMSEVSLGKALSKHDRSSYYLATKFPGHEVRVNFDPAAIFQEQLDRCGVEYFDFYLLHNVYENSIGRYMDERWNILPYLKEQKRLGRIKHLGFSCHARLEGMREFLDLCGDDMEFCQIQLNYLDWTLQDAKAKYELLTERGIPVWVMEPVRGGKLAKLSDENEAKLKALHSDWSVPSWGFRFLQGLGNVTMVLSGMNTMEQMVDNVNSFAEPTILSEAENALLMEIADSLKDSVPCTACRYCCDGCPKGLDIPTLIAYYNELRYSLDVNSTIAIDALPAEKKPTSCIGCGKCAQVCPQNINIPAELKNLTELLKKVPSWAETSRQREEAYNTRLGIK